MNLPVGWDDCGFTNERWSEIALRLRAEFARRVRTKPGFESLLDWGRHYLPNHFRRQASAMHVWLAEQFDAMRTERGQKINAIGPRGGAKSTLGTLAHVLRAALEGWEPYIWIVSDTKEQAALHLKNIKEELLTNKRLAADYPHAVGQGDSWRSQGIRLRHGVTIEAFGTLQRLRGRRQGAFRPTLVVCDDVENDSHMRSARQREAGQLWFQGTLLKAGTKETNFVNLATALHPDALALRLHRTPGWNSRVFAAIQEWPQNMSLWHDWESIYCDRQRTNAGDDARAFYDANRAIMDEGAMLLWPDEEDLYTLMRMRVEGGKSAFEREKQGVPLNPEDCEWPEEYFDESIWFDEWPSSLQVKTIALDPSKGSDSRRGDFSAIVRLGIDYAGLLYVEADLARRGTPEIVAAAAEACLEFGPHAFGVETNQYQELLSAELAAEFGRRQIHGVQPWNIDNRVNKLVRIRRLGPYLAARRLRFHAKSPGTRLLVEQLRDFPAGDHDDGPDALEMATRLASELLAPAARDELGSQLPLETVG